jgi:hypothetical protein
MMTEFGIRIHVLSAGDLLTVEDLNPCQSPWNGDMGMRLCWLQQSNENHGFPRIPRGREAGLAGVTQAVR